MSNFAGTEICVELQLYSGIFDPSLQPTRLFDNLTTPDRDMDPAHDAAHLASPYAFETNYSSMSAVTGGDPFLEYLKFYLSRVINPALCVFGLIGNVFTVVVLSRRRMKAAMNCTMEQAAHTGLIALAVSDGLYCASALIGGLLDRSQTVYRDRFLLQLVKIYGPYLQNTFMHTGTWLTVVMAAGRYAAICRPIQARYLVGVNCTRVAVAVIFAVWLLLELPLLWTYQIQEFDCPPAGLIFLLDQGAFVLNGDFKTTFTYVWAMAGFFLPVIFLAYCNYHLIRRLRESCAIRKLYRVNVKLASTGSRVTPTLVAIVCMFLLLNTPSEVLQFYYYTAHLDDVEIVTTAIVVTNVLQTINFAFNFVLYCIVNVHFRETWKELVYCAACRPTVGGASSPVGLYRHPSTVIIQRGQSIKMASMVETVM